jgi:hypothetical protein
MRRPEQCLLIACQQDSYVTCVWDMVHVDGPEAHHLALAPPSPPSAHNGVSSRFGHAACQRHRGRDRPPSPTSPALWHPRSTPGSGVICASGSVYAYLAVYQRYLDLSLSSSPALASPVLPCSCLQHLPSSPPASHHTARGHHQAQRLVQHDKTPAKSSTSTSTALVQIARQVRPREIFAPSSAMPHARASAAACSGCRYQAAACTSGKGWESSRLDISFTFICTYLAQLPSAQRPSSPCLT